jgi:hypothetical protein
VRSISIGISSILSTLSGGIFTLIEGTAYEIGFLKNKHFKFTSVKIEYSSKLYKK